MGLQFAAACGIGAVSTWGLKHVFHRPAANFPGKVALYVDPDVIAHLATRLREGSVVVVGTNGKTTTTNLLADVIEASGKTVVCNRTGANLDSGVATSLLQSKGADWGVFETDELWLARILPRLQATYVLLLNLFRDQLDRWGEIDRIQESIIGALRSSPNTTLVYNAIRWTTPPWRSASPKTWACRRIPLPTRRCASAARPCSSTRFANMANWEPTGVLNVGSGGRRSTTRYPRRASPHPASRSPCKSP